MKTSELFNIGTFSFINGKDKEGFFHLINGNKIRLEFYNVKDPNTYFNQPEEVLTEDLSHFGIQYHKQIKDFYKNDEQVDLKEKLKEIEKDFSQKCFAYDILPRNEIKEEIENLVKEGDKIYIQLKTHI